MLLRALSLLLNEFQIILDALGSAVSQDEDCQYLDSLIGCCHSLITSPTLSYIFMARLDQMVGFYRKVPKFLDTRKFPLNQPEIQTKRPNHRLIGPKDASEMANSGNADQTAPLIWSAAFG